MEANNFIARLKADTSDKYKCNLRQVLEEYKAFSVLPAKDRGLFGLNVLRTLCWNLDKAPIWRDNVDEATLLTLAIDCIRDTRQMEREDRVKSLACIYHIHKYATKVNKSIPPELVLKISIMPFELDSIHLLKEYHKTYWHILADRLTYIERLKTKVNITKLLPKLTEDIMKIIELYNTVQFCSTIIVFLFKKLHMLYSDTDAGKLVQPFKQIFTTLCRKDDIEELKELPGREILDIYTKLNECLYVIADNSSKNNFKDGILVEVARKCARLVVHRTDLTYCLQTFITSFSEILSHNTDIPYIETVFSNLEIALQDGIKPGYDTALLVTYPYLNQLLRIYIEYMIMNSENISEKIQESCLKLTLFFMKNLKNCIQILKCENCQTRTGLHDAFRLSLLSKMIVQNVQNATVLDAFYLITIQQYVILAELKELGCNNYQKFFRKLQTDIHNTAISFNKSKLYEISVKLFDTYLKNELKCTEIDHKNISRALFNKSICELDSELYERALINAFLSLTFAREEGLKTDKYMNLVMDIKARELKSKCNDGEELERDDLQLVTVMDACKMALDRKLYGDLLPFLTELKFSELLQHELSMYAKLWPSIAPVGGVWRALHTLARGGHTWIKVENQTTILEVLYDVILETPSVVRTVHSPYFSTIVGELLDDFDNMATQTPDDKLVHASLLFLQCEYDLAAASQKYEWKITEPGTNPDSMPASRTIPQEHAATRRATVAVQLLRDLTPNLHLVSQLRLQSALQIFQVFVPLLQQLCRDVQALQLASYCCLIADTLQHRESYLRCAGVLLTSSRPSPPLDDIVDRAARGERAGWGEEELTFLCDVAMYYKRDKPGLAARLVQLARARISHAAESQPDLNLELAVGRLLEVQSLLYGDSSEGPSTLAAATGVLRHYLALGVTGTKWTGRRLRALTIRVRTSVWCVRACALARALGLRSRARVTAAAGVPAGGAGGAARLHAEITDVTNFNATQIKIDQYLKEILGLQPCNETQPSCQSTHKQPLFTPRQELETMRDNMIFRRHQTSPSGSLGCTVAAYKVPDFYHHPIKCNCYACEIPTCILLSCITSSIEASMYGFAKENEIARNYFKGVLNMINIADKKLKQIKKMYIEMYDDFIVDSVMNTYDLDFKTMKIKLLIDLVYFELRNEETDAADEHIIEINEMVQEMNDTDQYLMNEILNLMTVSAVLKKSSKKPDKVFEEFESLQISPTKENIIPPSTPESKPTRPPKPAAKMVVKKEELPQKRMLIELRSFELKDDDDFEKPKTLTRGAKKDKFKVPNPIIPKPALEEVTPRPSRSRPHILVTTPSVDMATPKSQQSKENNEFFTPIGSTPEVFLTPMTSVKTYAKRSLRQNIVKNLEHEFSTPGSSAGKENRTENSAINPSTIKMEKTLVKKEKLIVKEEKPVVKEIRSIVKEERSNVRKEKIMAKKQDENSRAKGDTSKKIPVKEALNVPGRSRSKKEEKRGLIRAVSPGKMDKERDTTTRTRRQ